MGSLSIVKIQSEVKENHRRLPGLLSGVSFQSGVQRMSADDENTFSSRNLYKKTGICG